MLHTELRKQGGHINFWKKDLSKLVSDNSPSVLKIPLAKEMANAYKGSITTQLAYSSCCWQEAEL